ncbi:hypothetical protein [Gandjariella thermophila]|nr:hypothetical protein [Gandjariella thermophila]
MSRHGSGEEPPEGRADRDPWLSVSARRPRRRRVVLAEARGRSRVMHIASELEEQTSVGEALVRNLVRAQMRAAMLSAAVALGLLLPLPLVFAFFPALGDISVLGIRLPWLVLGLAPFPLLYLVGRRYNRAVETHEKDFVNMVES